MADSKPLPADDARPGAAAEPGAATPPITDAFSGLLRSVMTRSRTEVERFAADSRVRLELRQLRKDRAAMYAKLGKEVRALLEAGELEHPGLRRGVERIAELDARIERTAAQVGPEALASAAADGEVDSKDID